MTPHALAALVGLAGMGCYTTIGTPRVAEREVVESHRTVELGRGLELTAHASDDDAVLAELHEVALCRTQVDDRRTQNRVLESRTLLGWDGPPHACDGAKPSGRSGATVEVTVRFVGLEQPLIATGTTGADGVARLAVPVGAVMGWCGRADMTVRRTDAELPAPAVFTLEPAGFPRRPVDEIEALDASAGRLARRCAESASH